MTNHIAEAVIKAIAKQKQLDPAAISSDSILVALGISSLDAITIVYEMEEMFDVEVPNEELENLKTVQDIVDGIIRLISARG